MHHQGRRQIQFLPEEKASDVHQRQPLSFPARKHHVIAGNIEMRPGHDVF